MNKNNKKKTKRKNKATQKAKKEWRKIVVDEMKYKGLLNNPLENIDLYQ